jgi:hypothetical protein
MAVIRRLIPLAASIATAAAIAAAAFAMVSAFPQPTRGDRTGVRLLDVLETHRGVGSTIAVAGRSIVARCERLSRRRSLVSFSDGSALVLAGSHIRAAKPARRTAQRSATRDLANRHVDSPLLRVAQADLAGSYKLYATELRIQLERGSRIIREETTYNGIPAYQVELGSALPRASLIVDRETLQPLAATFESAALDGNAILAPPTSFAERSAC